MRCVSDCDKNISRTYSASYAFCGNDIRVRDLRGVAERSIRPIMLIW